MDKPPPATLWDIRWFRNTCLTVLLAPPLLFIVWAVVLMLSGELTFQQVWNGASIPLVLAMFGLSLFWFMYRWNLTTQNLNPEPDALDVRWSGLKLVLFCIPLIVLIPVLVVSGSTIFGLLTLSGFVAVAAQPELLVLFVFCAVLVIPYYFLFTKRVPYGAFALTEQGLVIPFLCSDQPVPWKDVWPSAGLEHGRLPLDMGFLTLTLDLDPRVYPNVRGRPVKPDLVRVSYSFPAAFNATKWSILKRIEEFKARDARSSKRPSSAR